MIRLRPAKYRSLRKGGFQKAGRRERDAERQARQVLVREFEPVLEESFASYRVRIQDFYAGTGPIPGAITAGQIGIPFGATRDLQADMGTALSQLFFESLLRGAKIGQRFAGRAQVDVDPDVITSRAIAWIEGPGGERIARIQQTLQEDIGQIVASAVRQTVSPGEAAERIGNTAGLTARQARALDRFEAQLRARRIPEGFEPTERIENAIRRDVENRRRRLLRQRGNLILETEVQEALQQGEREFWEQAIEEQQVEAGAVYKRWKTVLDNRVCPICEPLHNIVLPFDDSYFSRGFAGVRPPAHPACRCYLEIDATGEDFGPEDVRR